MLYRAKLSRASSPRRETQRAFPTVTFADHLADAAKRVESRMLELLRAEADGGAPNRMIEAMRHALLAGGKRVRPFLVIESAKLFDIAPDAALDAACAVECIHAYSLVHDDLPAMDNDIMRRGQPTVWTAFDEWTAILAGDGLQTLAFECLAQSPAIPSADIRLELIAALARASGVRGMVGGQALDLEAETAAASSPPTRAGIERLQGMKTGALIAVSAEFGAILADAPDTHRAALRSYGQHLGFAFQIADDLLDAEGDANVVGKAVAKDTDKGKATLIGLMGIETARAELAAAEAGAIAALDIFGETADTLKAAAHFVATRNS